MTGPWVVTARPPRSGRCSFGPARWSPNPLASTGTESAVTTRRGSRRTCDQARERVRPESRAPGLPSLCLLSWPVATVDGDAVTGMAGQIGSAAADSPPLPPGPDRPVPAGKSQGDGDQVLLVRDARHWCFPWTWADDGGGESGQPPPPPLRYRPREFLRGYSIGLSLRKNPPFCGLSLHRLNLFAPAHLRVVAIALHAHLRQQKRCGARPPCVSTVTP